MPGEKSPGTTEEESANPASEEETPPLEAEEDLEEYLEEEPPEPLPIDPPPGPRYRPTMRLQVGDRSFDFDRGHIVGRPKNHESTRSYASTTIDLADPDGSIGDSLPENMQVSVVVGFADGEMRTRMMGKIAKIERLGESTTRVLVYSAARQARAASSDAATTEPASGGRESEESVDRETEETDGEATEESTADPESEVEEEEPPSESVPSTIQVVGANNFEREVSRYRALAAMVRGERSSPTREILTRATYGLSGVGGALRFENRSGFGNEESGALRVNQSPLDQAAERASLQGDEIVDTGGNVIRSVGPGQEISSGVVLNYRYNKPAFWSTPRVTLLSEHGRGALTIQGYDATGQQTVRATVVSPGDAPPHPTGEIEVPQWSTIALSDLIEEGNLYTWNDATRNGERIPEGPEVIERIIRVARELQRISDEYEGGERLEITSWYRPPDINAAIGGATNSRHIQGDAVDFWSPNMDRIFADLNASHEGGIAISPGSFIHVDMRHLDGEARARWTY